MRHESCMNKPIFVLLLVGPADAEVDVLPGGAVEPRVAADRGDASGEQRVERARVRRGPRSAAPGKLVVLNIAGSPDRWSCPRRA